MCQGCVNEGYLTQVTHDKIEAFAKEWPTAESGPAHIVVADDNVRDSDIQHCLIGVAASKDPDFSDAERVATHEFLETLLAIPESDI